MLPIQWGVVLGASLAAAFTDLRSRRIPNLLTLPLLVAGLMTAWAIGGGPGLADAAAASVVLALPYVFLFLFANGGAGDAKLMGAVGAWLGVANGILALLCVSLAGVVYALVQVWLRRDKSIGRMETMPYGMAICLGLFAAAVARLLW